MIFNIYAILGCQYTVHFILEIVLCVWETVTPLEYLNTWFYNNCERFAKMYQKVVIYTYLFSLCNSGNFFFLLAKLSVFTPGTIFTRQ